MKLLSKQLIGIIALILFITGAATLTAQDRDEPISVSTDLVLVNVLVTDGAGKPVKGLTNSNFDLFVDDAKHPVESFSPGDGAVSFGIVYDMHPTTFERTRAVIDSLQRFKARMEAADDIFLVAFNMQGQQTFDFVPTVEQLERHMASPAKRELRSLYDAVYFASEKIRSARNHKKVLLIISDSADHHSRHKFTEVQNKLAELKAEVYAVITDDGDDFGYADITRKSQHARNYSKDASPLDRAALMELTHKSGGGTYLGGAGSSGHLFNIYNQVAGEVRSSYTLGFYPGVKDSRPHDIRLKLRGVKRSKDFVLTYRMSYQMSDK
jgi:Ca-activated chloride channel homolog